MQTCKTTLSSLAAALLLTAWPALAQNAPAAPPANLFANGDFEAWAKLEKPDPKRTPQLADGLGPVWWWVSMEAYERGKEPDFAVQGRVTRDTQVKHGGAAAVRLDAGLPTDVVEVSTPTLAVQPDTEYAVRGWVRAEGIKLNKDGAGAVVWMNFGPKGKFWEKQHMSMMKLKAGESYDWTPFEFRIHSQPEDGEFRLILQLRRAAGTLWFDDVELVPVPAPAAP